MWNKLHRNQYGKRDSTEPKGGKIIKLTCFEQHHPPIDRARPHGAIIAWCLGGFITGRLRVLLAARSNSQRLATGRSGRGAFHGFATLAHHGRWHAASRRCLSGIWTPTARLGHLAPKTRHGHMQHHARCQQGRHQNRLAQEPHGLVSYPIEDVHIPKIPRYRGYSSSDFSTRTPTAGSLASSCFRASISSPRIGLASSGCGLYR